MASLSSLAQSALSFGHSCSEVLFYKLYVTRVFLLPLLSSPGALRQTRSGDWISQ